jgi:hypothetical protein
MATPAEKFHTSTGGQALVSEVIPDRTGDQWVSRRVCANGIVCVAWQQVSVGVHRCDVHIDGNILRFWIGNDLVKTAARTTTGAVRIKRASRTRSEA